MFKKWGKNYRQEKDNNKIKEVIIIKNKTQLKNLIENEEDLTHIDVSNITNMNFLFRGVKKIKGDISNWDVSKVKTMREMFAWSSFNQNISKWNVSKVKDMEQMFQNTKFNQNISKWNVSNVENMQEMFLSSEFNQDISKWNVSNVENMNRWHRYRSVADAVLAALEGLANLLVYKVRGQPASHSS